MFILVFFFTQTKYNNKTNCNNQFFKKMTGEKVQIINCTLFLRVPLCHSCIYITTVYIIIAVSSAILSLFLNVLTLVAIYKTRSLHTVQYVFICNTTICDIAMSLLVVPLWSFVMTASLYEVDISCDIATALGFVSTFTGIISFLSLGCTVFDLYLVLLKPYFYHEKIHDSPRYYITVCIIMWLLNIVIHVFATVMSARKLTTTCVAIISPMMTIVCYYLTYKIYHVILKVYNTAQSSSAKVTMHQNEIDIEKKKKFFKLTLVMLLSLTVCYAPFGTINMIRIISLKLYQEDNMLHMFHQLSCTLIFVKALINPLSYCYQGTKLRKAITNILFKLFCAKKVSPQIQIVS